jgi:hypothetical protein
VTALDPVAGMEVWNYEVSEIGQPSIRDLEYRAGNSVTAFAGN